jgi:hypothetical protein
LGRNRIAWLDLTGAENEIAAHLAELSRMTIMWCSLGAASGGRRRSHPSG